MGQIRSRLHRYLDPRHFGYCYWIITSARKNDENKADICITSSNQGVMHPARQEADSSGNHCYGQHRLFYMSH